MKFSYILLLLIGLGAYSSCKKKSDNVFLANEGTQGFEGNGYTDSFTLLTSTVREDSLKTDSLSNNTIGVINDALYGQYKATSFFQFRLPQFGNVISGGTLDSAVLIMQYTSASAYYGNLASSNDFEVHELTDDMKRGTHSNGNYNYSPTVIGTYSGKFKLSDSTSIRNLGSMVKVAPSMRIRLSTAFAQKLFNATSSDLASQESFINFFKGIAVVPTSAPAPGDGAIAAINIKGAISKIRIYYDNDKQSDFEVQTDSRTFTKFDITGQSNTITQQKVSGLKGNFDTCYVMGMSGAKMRIRIPYLFNIAKSGKTISIAKAEVIIRPVAGMYNSTFPLPSRLLLLQPSAANNINNGILDLAEPFYGGNLNSTTNEYKFNITRHIQNLFIDYRKGVDNNRGLYIIVPTDYPIAPSRMAIDTRKKLTNAGIEFRLYYTEL